jgi:hypothetical protein
MGGGVLAIVAITAALKGAIGDRPEVAVEAPLAAADRVA